MQTHTRAQMRHHIGAYLGRVNEQINRAGLRQNSKSLHHRIFGNIRAANIQEPTDRIWQRQNGRLLPSCVQTGRQPCAFRCGGFAGQIVRMHKDLTLRRCRLIGPNGINQIIRGAQGDVGTGQGGLKFFNLVRRMKPRIKANHPSGEIFQDPRAGFDLGPRHGGEMGQIDLQFHLRAVAPIDKNARLLWQNDAKSCGSGKARQPLQAFIARGDIFALMRIGAGDQVTSQARFG